MRSARIYRSDGCCALAGLRSQPLPMVPRLLCALPFTKDAYAGTHAEVERRMLGKILNALAWLLIGVLFAHAVLVSISPALCVLSC